MLFWVLLQGVLGAVVFLNPAERSIDADLGELINFAQVCAGRGDVQAVRKAVDVASAHPPVQAYLQAALRSYSANSASVSPEDMQLDRQRNDLVQALAKVFEGSMVGLQLGPEDLKSPANPIIASHDFRYFLFLVDSEQKLLQHMFSVLQKPLSDELQAAATAARRYLALQHYRLDQPCPPCGQTAAARQVLEDEYHQRVAAIVYAVLVVAAVVAVAIASVAGLSWYRQQQDRRALSLAEITAESTFSPAVSVHVRT